MIVMSAGYSLAAVAAGGLILIIGGVVLFRSYTYYRMFSSLEAKKLARLSELSALMAVFGSLSVIYSGLTGENIWPIIAAFYSVSYLLVLWAVLYYLDMLYRHSVVNKKGEEPPGEVEESKNLLKGGFSISPEQIRYLSAICNRFNGKVYVGRSRKPRGCDAFDLSLWLTRIEAPNSVDPSKLHVIQGRILEFLAGKKGSLVVLDGIEYLLLHNDFKGLVKFLTSLKDHVLLYDSLLIVILDPRVLDRRQHSVLLREFPEFNFEEIITEEERKALFGALTKEELEKAEETRQSGTS